MTTASTPTTGGSKVRVGVQRFGTFLSGMIMPNIPALIAWGIFTAFFIEVGWTPNADLATIVGPFIHYLLPIIIAYTGGNIVYGIRGGVVASIAVMGAIAGSDLLIAQFNATLPEGEAPLGQVHMFIGAMIMAPLAPGSIIAVLAQTANGSYFAVILSVVLAAAVTFVLTAIILRASRKRDLEAMAATVARRRRPAAGSTPWSSRRTSSRIVRGTSRPTRSMCRSTTS